MCLEGDHLIFPPSPSTAHPKSLMSQSRLVMRRLLKQAGRPHALGELEIPTVLVNYLQHQP